MGYGGSSGISVATATHVGGRGGQTGRLTDLQKLQRLLISDCRLYKDGQHNHTVMITASLALHAMCAYSNDVG